MNFFPSPTPQSFLYAVLVSLLWPIHVYNPAYNWPEDYLTRAPFNCKSAGCEVNACTASALNNLPTFDYIIIGSGPAGSTIAHRLARKFSDRKVLLIEAGVEPLIESLAPKLWPFNLNTTASYKFFAQKSAAYSNAFKNSSSCISGRTIGGSTQINAMMYVCGTDQNYDDWAEAAGDSSWNYDNMLPLIKQNQNMKDTSLTKGKCSKFYGTRGPLVVDKNQYDLTDDNMIPILRSAAKELNYSELEDVNCGAPYTGFVNVRSTVNNGQRETAARAFLVPIRDSPNFYYMRESFVDRILLEKDSSGSVVVRGVSILTEQPACRNIEVQAKREVVVSAGAYGSTKILQKSGLGRSEDLATCGIKQVIDLPVGRNLADHFLTIHYFTMPGDKTSTQLGADLFFGAQGLQYTTDYSGYFSTAGFNYHGFINTTSRSSDYPDIQYIFGQFDQNLVDFDVIVNDRLGFKKEFADQLSAANEKFSIVQVINILLQPKSRGTVKVGDCNDPHAAPRIDGNYVSEPEDVETILRGMKFINEFFQTNAAKSAGIKPLDLKIPECDIHLRFSEAYNRCYARYFSQNLWHPSGTAKMGKSAADSVVDSKLRVFGVKRSAATPMLRVADAGIMPFVTSGNTQCPTYAIGEKAAAIIINEK